MAVAVWNMSVVAIIETVRAIDRIHEEVLDSTVWEYAENMHKQYTEELRQLRCKKCGR